jgi:hypothetical protein
MKKTFATIFLSFTVLTSFGQLEKLNSSTIESSAPSTASLKERTISTWQSASMLIRELIPIKDPEFNKTELSKYIKTEISDNNLICQATANALKTVSPVMYNNDNKKEVEDLLTKLSMMKDLNFLRNALVKYESFLKPSLLSDNWKRTVRDPWLKKLQQ